MTQRISFEQAIIRAFIAATDRHAVDVEHSVLPDGAATEATLAAFMTENHADFLALLAFYAANFGAATGAIRTAAQIGNAAGAADFNSGTSGAQTLRTAANNFGIARTSAPTASANAAIIQRVLDEYGRTFSLSQEYSAALWGTVFSVATNVLALTGTTETPLLLFKHPASTGKIVKFSKMTFGPTLGNNYCTYRLYLNPTITTNGTALTPVGNRQVGQASTVAQVFLNPTISANGAFIRARTASGLSGATVIDPLNFSLLLDPNNNFLITRKLSANATIGGVDLEWSES